MLYVVMDTETTVRNRGEGAVGSFAGSPFCPANHIVSIGEWHEKEGYKDQYDAEGKLEAPYFLRRAAAGKDTRVVGHNVGFDLHYVRKTWPGLYEAAQPYLYIWDTQQVEYLLSGQSILYPSLDQCCEVRGLPLKDSRIKDYWDSGLDTPHIPKDELLEYQKGDVANTRDVFLSQRAELSDNPSLYELVLVKMDDLLSTIEMSYNGMAFDLQFATAKLEELDAKKAVVYNMLMEELKRELPPHAEPNVDSGEQISAMLFGGSMFFTEPVVQRHPDGAPITFKTGQKKGEVKTKQEKVEYKIKGLGLPTEGIPKLKKGHYSTDSEFLEKLDHPLVTALLEYRELNKDTETYYRGYSQHVWFDNCIHPSINQESTRTGRQSVSSPNLQNVTKEDE